MKNKISLAAVGFFLAISLKGQGVTLSSALNPDSSAGNFYGTLCLSFSSTNSSDCYYDSLNRFEWTTAQILPVYSDATSDAQISLSFTLGTEGSQTLNLYAGLTSFSDAQFGTVNDTSGTASTSPGKFVPGQAVSNNMVSTGNNQQTYFDYADKLLITYNFNYTLPVVFNGTSGSADGAWSLTYTVTPVPEPSANWLLLLGGAGFLAARQWFRRA
jgi:hypothetical protein